MKNNKTVVMLIAVILLAMNACKKENQDPILNGPPNVEEMYKKGGSGGGGSISDTTHIASVNVISYFKTQGQPGPTGFPRWQYAGEKAQVQVVNSLGTPVQGVTVAGNWSGCFTSAKSGITDSNGFAFIDGVNNPPIACTATFTITGISKSGSYYNAGANLTVSGSKVYL